jgi:hypothetical protein
MSRRRGTTREAYETPRVRRIRLVADELAVAGCKSTPVSGSRIVCRRGRVIVNRTIGS